jgi:PAS domain-containing protein
MIAEKYLQTILENSADGVIVVGDRDIVGMCNAVATRMFGYSESEIFGKHVDNLISSLREACGQAVDQGNLAVIPSMCQISPAQTMSRQVSNGGSIFSAQ